MQKELQKEEKVTDVHDENSGIVFKGRPASLAPDDVEGCHADNGPNDHLGYLRNGNPFGVEPAGLALNGHEEIVKVHDGVDAVVDGGVNETGRTVRDKGVPRAEQDGDMVVPVEQHEVLFVGNDKEGIKEFTVVFLCVCLGVVFVLMGCVREYIGIHDGSGIGVRFLHINKYNLYLHVQIKTNT